ncbi:acyl-CoA dehydrogenase [Thalassobaculum sp.]|uniref:acyl-CoA dehydrogenase n=1 Tax=Thalassobaculum sp. TaxID=2022740 RepID=UPI0032EBE49E
MAVPLIDPDDLAFTLWRVLDADSLLAYPRFADHDREAFAQVIDTARRIAEAKFLPHAAKSDANEPRLENGKVVLIPEIGEALQAFSDAGFMAAHHDHDRGGMQLPWTIQQAAFAHFKAANTPTVGYAFLTIAAANLIHAHGSTEQQRLWMAPMLDGRFFGTMALSEPHAGSSLSDVRTAARPLGGERYAINGSKMWTSGGEHEMTRNIVHMTLARIEGAPAGVKGLSLFIVPRYRLDEAGEPAEPNDVTLIGLNHKMGYRGTVNTALAFGENDDCVGWLVGEPNRGLAQMFHMMNEARVGVAMGAIMLAYQGYLVSLDYARTRPQGRHPGDKDPTTPQLPLIEHADVRRMLLQQKAVAEGGLMLALDLAMRIDRQHQDPDAAVRRRETLLLDFLTPIIKAWFTDRALEANSNAIQILGGYGYTRDYPVERLYRDNRLNPIHEGTNAIQAIDLLGRKAGMAEGAAFAAVVEEIRSTLSATDGRPEIEALHRETAAALDRLTAVTAALLKAAPEIGPVRLLANAAAYMDLAGLTVFGWLWLRQALAALEDLPAASEGRPRDFLLGKLHTARYVAAWELPRTAQQAALLGAFDDTLATMGEAWF